MMRTSAALSQDYWMPSVQVLWEYGIAGAPRGSKGRLNLPYLMTKFVGISSSLVPELGTKGVEQDAVLLMGQDGPSLWEGFSSSSPDAITGRATRWTETKALNATQAQVDIKEGFVADKTGLSAMYVSRGTFDLSEGLLQQSQGVYELKDKGQTTRVTVSVRRLVGAAFDLAKKEALEKLADLPKEVVPVELARKPLDLRLPSGYYSTQEPPAKNQVAAYYDQNMKQYFEVVAVQRGVDMIKIRFQGSGETLAVAPTALAKIDP